MLLYGLSVGRVATLRHDDPHTDTDQRVWLRYGDHRLRPPPAIATLVLAQRDQTGVVSAIGRSHPNGVRWLFPGGFPGRPARDALYRGLREHLHGARSAALASLAAELPAAVVAHLLHVRPNGLDRLRRRKSVDSQVLTAGNR